MAGQITQGQGPAFGSTQRFGCGTGGQRHFFDDRIPFAARITSARPFGGRASTGLADKGCARFRHDDACDPSRAGLQAAAAPRWLFGSAPREQGHDPVVVIVGEVRRFVPLVRDVRQVCDRAGGHRWGRIRAEEFGQDIGKF